MQRSSQRVFATAAMTTYAFGSMGSSHESTYHANKLWQIVRVIASATLEEVGGVACPEGTRKSWARYRPTQEEVLLFTIHRYVCARSVHQWNSPVQLTGLDGIASYWVILV